MRLARAPHVFVQPPPALPGDDAQTALTALR
jgi:hypothetical protein